MAKRYWNMGIVRLFNDVLYDEALSQTPNGLRYHIIDICVEELAKVNKEAAVSLTEATFLDCLEPFFAMVQRVQDKNVQKRVVDNVMMKFLNEYSFVSDAAVSEEEDVDGKDLIFHQVHVGTVAKFIFEIASDGDTDVRYRKCLYEMHKTFIRKIRAAGRDVDTEAGRDEEEEEEGEEDGCGACGTSETCVVVTPIDGATVTPDGTDEKASKEEPLSKKDKKMKRKNKDKAKKGVEEPDAAAASAAAADPDPEPKVEESVPATKSSKKKKRKQQQEETASEPAVTTPTAQSNDANETEQSNKSKKKKRKKEAQEDETLTTKIELPPVSKKKKKNQKAAEPEIAVNSNGEVVATSDGEEQGNAISASKRVSFGARNQSKSHKASMKALKTLTPKVWSTANRTPDKSILLKRAESEVKQIKTKKKKRRST
jgi:hypothetical protein